MSYRNRLVLYVVAAAAGVAWAIFNLRLQAGSPPTPVRPVAAVSPAPQAPLPPPLHPAFDDFAQAAALPVSHYSDAGLGRMLGAFHHVPFDQSGYNVVVLPFSYSDPDQVGDPNEANAFAQLLSYDTDWGPGSYTNRHAYFIFKRARALMIHLMAGYDAPLVAQAIADWNATNAIGGSLKRSKDGYTGQLMVYDRRGALVETKTYDRPQPYFDLLGDMSVDALTFFGPAPSARLAAFLHQPRCEHAESIAEYGKAAFMPERSDEEFTTYERIVKSDPSFAIVRYWSANQKSWTEPNTNELLQQCFQAIQARPDVAPLNDVWAYQYSKAGLLDPYEHCLDETYQLLSPAHPFVLAHRLDTGNYGEMDRRTFLELALKSAGRFPNSYNLLQELAIAYVTQHEGTPDYEMAASLAAANISNLFLTGNGNKYNAQAVLAEACIGLGRPDIAAQVLIQAGAGQPEFNLRLYARALCEIGNYSDVIDLYHVMPHTFDENSARQLLPVVAFAAAAAKMPHELDELLITHHDDLQNAGILDLVQAYRDMAAEKPVDLSTLQRLASNAGPNPDWNLLLVTEEDAMTEQSRFIQFARQLSWTCPEQRLGWIMMDGYERRKPNRDAAAFYDFLDWMHGSDPWVVKAVADYRRRTHNAEAQFNILGLTADLRKALASAPYDGSPADMDWTHVPMHWRVAAGIHQLIQEGNLQEAADIATLNRLWHTANNDCDQLSLSYVLERKVQEAMTGQN